MRFTDSHEWIAVEEGVGTVGITSHAQNELGEVVYVELPSLGKHVRAGEEIAVLESTKAAADVYSPVTGEIIAINQNLGGSPDSLNRSPEGEGWLFKIKILHPEELSLLLDSEKYLEMIQSL